MTDIKHQLAHELLAINAVELSPNEPFTWASGLKSPIYCDNRLTISYPQVRKIIVEGIVEIINEHFPDVEIIAGTATAGIPHAAFIADAANLPMIYVRSKPKDHGQGRQIEGVMNKGQKVLVIDDLISTGGSVLKAVDAVKNEGGNVVGVASIFTYQLSQATENFANADVPYYSVTNYETLIDVAKNEHKINDTELASLKQWRQDPVAWGVGK